MTLPIPACRITTGDDTQGKNGAMMMTRASKQKGKASLLNDCIGACEVQGLVTTKVVVVPRRPRLEITRTQVEDYFR